MIHDACVAREERHHAGDVVGRAAPADHVGLHPGLRAPLPPPASSGGGRAVVGVSIVLRLTQFTVIAWRPTSRAIDRQKPAAPAFAAAYGATFEVPYRPASDTIVTTRPHSLAIIDGSAARVQCMTPNRLTAKKRCQSAGSESTKSDEAHEALGARVARVVDEDVDAAVAVDRRRDLRPVGDVERQRVRLAAGRAQLLDGRLGLRRRGCR